MVDHCHPSLNIAMHMIMKCRFFASLSWMAIVATSHAQTTPLPDPGARAMQVAWMHPANSPAVIKTNQYAEFGFKLQMEHRRKIDNFLADRGVPDRINPFDPRDFDVQAFFTRIDTVTGDTLELQRRFAFWYREFERDLSSPKPEDWKHREKTDLFKMRFRFAAPTAGVWLVQARVIAQEKDTVYTDITRFEVTPDANSGFLTVGESKRYFTRDNETFFPVGQNLPWPTCSANIDSVCATVPCAKNEPYCHGRTINPYGYLVYHKQMELLKASGANYFRMLIAPWNLEIEFEELNNYDARMHCAWEIDQILAKAEELGLLIHFNLQVHYPFENPSVYSMYNWDYGDIDCFAYDEPYCYFDELQLKTPRDFLASEAAQRHYKNRLRYLIARYGYATSIGVLELFSEANNLGQAGHVDANCVIDKNKHQNQPYHTEAGYAEQLGRWHKELARYVKEDLGHSDHILAVNYTGPPEFVKGDSSFYWSHVDLATFNSYHVGINKLYKASEMMTAFRRGSKRKKQDNFNPPALNKPFMHSEIGPGLEGVEFCDDNLRWIQAVWLSPLTGMAGTAMNWSNQEAVDLWPHLGRIVQWFSAFRLDEQRFINQRAERKDNRAELLALRSTRGERIAIGAIHNRTVNFYTRANQNNPACTNTADPFIGSLPAVYKQAVDVTNDRGGNALAVTNMGSLLRYTIEFRDPYTWELVATTEQRTTASGRLRIDYPVLSANGSAFYLFTATRLK